MFKEVLNNKQNTINIDHNEIKADEPSAKKQGLPSIEELMLQRDKDIR